MYVTDVAKTLEFYNEAFGFEIKFITPENDYGELTTGDVTLSFANHTLASSNFKSKYTQSDLQNSPFGVEIGITTDDVESAVKQAIDFGASLFEDVATKPWGQKVAYVRDINGFLVEICTPIA